MKGRETTEIGCEFTDALDANGVDYVMPSMPSYSLNKCFDWAEQRNWWLRSWLSGALRGLADWLEGISYEAVYWQGLQMDDVVPRIVRQDKE